MNQSVLFAVKDKKYGTFPLKLIVDDKKEWCSSDNMKQSLSKINTICKRQKMDELFSFSHIIYLLGINTVINCTSRLRYNNDSLFSLSHLILPLFPVLIFVFGMYFKHLGLRKNNKIKELNTKYQNKIVELD